ncbi:Zinc finger, FYVE-type [Corchorus capsularis]|uniref:Zinc finger, FYVE-type n=1 Tax=Corchorus capsularis TaxID=210143 RepID=A0A1R3KDQ9_COCAP|nr:Zinc finger, FYVE-type [Corchorus capsularis]
MGEADSFASSLNPFDRHVDQAILAMKKGAHLLKCGRRGKPKFCPFRLSTDEKYLIWYSGQEERQLRLSSVMKIVTGQKTVNFQRQLQPDREQQSISLIYANGERSLDLICKDKAQADSWFVGLRAVISRYNNCRSISTLRSRRGAQSCISSPAGFIRRKHNLGLLEDNNQLSQVRSVCGSPSQSLSERCFSDGLSYTSDSFYSSESNLSQKQNVMDTLMPTSPYIEPDNLKQCGIHYPPVEFQKNISRRFVTPMQCSPLKEKNEILKDVMIWGEGVLGGNICGATDISVAQNGFKADALFPKLLESATMLDVHRIALGARHAALVTKQGECFCWGDGNGGRLGHKTNMDISYPKLVESLTGVAVQAVACGEYQTCALTQSGEVYTWGGNFHCTDLVVDVGNTIQWLPHKISGPLDCINVHSISCGEWHTAIVSTAGQLFTYGDGTFGVLGHGNTQSFLQPKEVESLKGLWVRSVSCGPWHTAAIVETMYDHSKLNAIGGKLFTWGDGDKGRLGHADGERKLSPTCVVQLVDLDFVQVSCGRMLTAALTSLGTVYTMGSSIHGQLGNPKAKDKSITIVEGKLKQEFVREISSGSYHVAVLTSGGNVYTWGKGTNGQLGLGDIEDRSTPTLVEFLRDRQVESIACGSSLTAAICLHKSITISDQSACRGCKMPFGFTRKKHNCYNCGLQFCHACSSKKVANASLAPNKSKPSRVCNPCFNHLQKITNSTYLSKLENPTPSQPLTPQRTFLDEKDTKEVLTTKSRLLLSGKHSTYEENQETERKTLKPQSEKLQYLETSSYFSSATPRWGQVPCPVLFEAPHNSLQKASLQSKSAILNSIVVENDLPESNQMLNEEVQRLKAEAKNLEMQCQIGGEKIQECQWKIDHNWSLAKEEAEKCKAAKEFIKALALRLHSMSEKFPAARELKAKFDNHLPTTMPLSTHIQLPMDRQVDSLCGTPIVVSNKLKSMQARDGGNEKDRPLQDSHATQMEPEKNGGKDSKHEWVEQYEPGVYVTFTTLASGQRGLKRVRFSRKRFTEKKAEKWWEDNQLTVYAKYGIEGYSKSNQNQSKS